MSPALTLDIADALIANSLRSVGGGEMRTRRVLNPGEGSEHGVKSIRKMLDEHGRLGAIQRLGEDRGLIEIASAYGMDESVGIPNFVYSGWCMTAFVNRRGIGTLLAG